ncbi:hypothetical protein BDQ17DRAFT_1334979 [Cyathus striatus]|nr:hypothetical protein BDQ17DRAFT_1334979 [Cyathus striatus]
MMKRKERHEIVDIAPERAAKIARTTNWRNSSGKTKKARAIQMQPSIASIFQAKPSKFKLAKIQEARQEEEESMDDVASTDEILDMSPLPLSPPCNNESINTSNDNVELNTSRDCEEENLNVTINTIELDIDDTVVHRANLKTQIKSAPWRTRHSLKKRLAKIRPATNASEAIALRCNRETYFQCSLHSMALHVLKTGQLPENRQGKGAQHASHLDRAEVNLAIQNWLKGEIPVDKGGFIGRLNAPKLRRYVNEFLFPSLGIEDTIGETTAAAWLKRLGFRMSCVRKGVYVDGHERPDVIVSRDEFLNFVHTQVLPFANVYEGEDLVEIKPNLSDEFIIEACGRLALSEEEIAVQMLLPERPKPPPEPALETTPLSTSAKTGKRKPKNARTPVATSSRTMQELENEWIPPPPPAPFTSYRLSSKLKGMEQVLRERGLLTGLEQKHGSSLAAREAALKDARSKQDEIEGSEFCGLADGTFKKAQELVPKCLDAVSTTQIRKFFRHCWRYMSAYKMGLNIKQAAYAVKEYTSHRRIPQSAWRNHNIIARQ